MHRLSFFCVFFPNFAPTMAAIVRCAGCFGAFLRCGKGAPALNKRLNTYLKIAI